MPLALNRGLRRSCIGGHDRIWGDRKPKYQQHCVKHPVLLRRNNVEIQPMRAGRASVCKNSNNFESLRSVGLGRDRLHRNTAGSTAFRTPRSVGYRTPSKTRGFWWRSPCMRSLDITFQAKPPLDCGSLEMLPCWYRALLGLIPCSSVLFRGEQCQISTTVPQVTCDFLDSCNLLILNVAP